MLGIRAATSGLGVWQPEAARKPVLKEKARGRGGGSLSRGRDDGVSAKCMHGPQRQRLREPARTRTQLRKRLSREVPRLQGPGCSALSLILWDSSERAPPCRKPPSLAVGHAFAYWRQLPERGRILILLWNFRGRHPGTD